MQRWDVSRQKDDDEFGCSARKGLEGIKGKNWRKSGIYGRSPDRVKNFRSAHQELFQRG